VQSSIFTFGEIVYSSGENKPLPAEDKVVFLQIIALFSRIRQNN
jgi:hypothetical protein